MNAPIITFFLVLAFVTTSISFSNAQCWNPKQKEGYANINIGVGLFPTYLKDEGKTKGLPVNASIDFRVQQNFSVGVFGGYSFTEGQRAVPGSETVLPYENRTLVSGLRFAAHSNPIGRFEVYGGMSGGLFMSHFEYLDAGAQEKTVQHGPESQQSRFYMTGFLGSRYCIAKKLSLFSELGMGDSLLKAGVSIRL